MATNNLLFISDANDFPSDEEHEKGLIKTNVLYRVNCTSDPPELVIRDDMSGRILSANLMDNSQVCFIYPSLERGGGGMLFSQMVICQAVYFIGLLQLSLRAWLFENRLALTAKLTEKKNNDTFS